MSKKNKGLIITFTVMLTIAVAACLTFFIYTGIYYHADKEAVDSYVADKTTVTVAELNDSTLYFKGEEVKAGFIFYPGGKVEYTAYIPLMTACAERGIACFLVKMPYNLAILKANAADGIKEQYSEISNWYIGGHSLGGIMAANYLVNKDGYSGLILLGSYSSYDISDIDIAVLSIYGSEDKVLNRDKYAKSKANYPDRFEERIIEGGCHSYFGMYGEQKGDGTPTISNTEQIELTAEMIGTFIS